MPVPVPVSRSRRWHAASAVVLAGLLVATGCLPNPQRAYAVSVLDQLTSARASLLARPADPRAPCDSAGSSLDRLYTNPGPAEAPDAWRALRDATESLLEACGSLLLLQVPGNLSPGVQEARDRWRRRAEQQLEEMCTRLQAAAGQLGQSGPTCSLAGHVS